MRKDMHKVIVEQERYDGGGLGRQSRNSGRGRSKFRADSDPDSYVGPETNRKLVYKYEYKSFRDHLSPLYRFLKQNVGRPWDKVYSEVCSQADARSVTGYHLRDHVHLYVCTDIEAAEEKIATLRDGAFWSTRTFGQSFYVDAHGLLRKFPARTKQSGNALPPYYEDSENPKLRYIMVAGCWYREDWAHMITHQVQWSDTFWSTETSPTVTQLSTKDIDRLGLRNMPVVNNEKVPSYAVRRRPVLQSA